MRIMTGNYLHLTGGLSVADGRKRRIRYTRAEDLEVF